MSKKKTVLEEIISEFEYIERLEERIKEATNSDPYNDNCDYETIEECKYEIEGTKSSIAYKIKDLQRYSLENNFYFFDCPLKVYQNHYDIRKEDFFNNNIDADEIDFIKSEVRYFNNFTNNRKLEHLFYQFNYNFKELDIVPLKISVEKKIKFLNNKLSSYGFIICETNNNNYNFDVSCDWFFEFRESNSKIIPTEIKRSNNVTGFKSFNYQRDALIIKNLFESLKSYRLICDTNKLKDFENAFVGKEIQKQVVWIGQDNELRYFIETLKDKSRIKESNLWSLTSKIFIKKDGSDYSSKNLRTNGAIPSNANLIDKITDELNTTAVKN